MLDDDGMNSFMEKWLLRWLRLPDPHPGRMKRFLSHGVTQIVAILLAALAIAVYVVWRMP